MKDIGRLIPKHYCVAQRSHAYITEEIVLDNIFHVHCASPWFYVKEASIFIIIAASESG